MNIVLGNWEQLKGNIQKHWGRLTKDDMSILEGNRKLLAGKIQERYGIAKEEAEAQVKKWDQYQQYNNSEENRVA